MKKKLVVLSMFFAVICCTGAYGAYFHMGEADAPKFQQAYPDLKDSKLDDCTLCHQGGPYVDEPGRPRPWVPASGVITPMAMMHPAILQKP